TSGLSEGARTRHGQSETNEEYDRDDTHWLSPPERARQRGSSVLRIRVSSRTWGQHTPTGAVDVPSVHVLLTVGESPDPAVWPLPDRELRRPPALGLTRAASAV